MGSPESFQPSEYMRARRPELFSDSTEINTPNLTHDVFEYHLDTLTNRKQETVFEHFCRRLAEKELCPNLIPQTGPTGGGDSKVDTETYPVAEGIALRWYDGTAQESSHERWAFAFSAKKDWQAKVNADVANIMTTDRNYKLVYFITNQYIKDKTRAQVQAALEKKYKIPVWLLDRSWIVKCVFEHDQVELAINTLNLTGYGTLSEKQIGPYDAAREIELKELEERVKDTSQYQGVDYQLAEDCLRTALLARGLNHSRIEVEGRFQRAERIANKVNLQAQRLRIAYAKAWTVFWWYDDYEELNRIYDEVEELAIDSSYTTDLELLVNLWVCIYPSVRRGNLTDEQEKFAIRTAALKKRLDELAVDKKRPNNALLAQIQRCLLDINDGLLKTELLNDSLNNLKEALIESEGLAECPIQPTLQIIQELGEFLSDSPVYDELFEVVVRLTTDRTSNGEAGVILLQRGTQKLKGGKQYDAIKLLGRAQQHLAMHEYRSERYAALVRCGFAYESAGLLWAARANTLLALNQVLSEFLKSGEMSIQVLKCVQRLVWLELQLGRVFSVLAWIEFASMIRNQTAPNERENAAFIEEHESQDLILGLLLLKTELWELKWIDFLPSILNRLGLANSRMALLYALGYENKLRAEGLITENDSEASVIEVFANWIRQPANKDLPDRPEFMRSKRIKLSSFVLGCEVVVEAENTLACVNLAETILSALEAFLATSLDNQLFPYRSELHIQIVPSDQVRSLPEYQIDETDSEHTVIVRLNSPQQMLTKEEKETFRTWLFDLIIELTFLLATADDFDAFMKQVIQEERSNNRALEFSDIAIVINNVFGQTPKFKLSDWLTDFDMERFPLRRTTPWNHDLKGEVDENHEFEWKPGTGEAPEGLFGIDNLKHKERRVFSLINKPLWDRAGWMATAYICVPKSVPILILGFKDADAAKRIFDHWRRKFGEVDENEQLRISIITGISRKNLAEYNVLISTNLSSIQITKQSILMSRFQRLTPPDLVNLNGFIDYYGRFGRYYLLPAHFVSESEIEEPFWDLRIEKQQLNIRPAWQIDENDFDAVVIREDDDPFIPQGVKDAPVLRALKRFAKHRKQ